MYFCKKCNSKTFVSQLQIFNKNGTESKNSKFNKVICCTCGNSGKRLKDITNRRHKK